jgi:hypothetical protein
MAKNGKGGVSYIQMIANQRGENWLVTLRPEDIQNSTRRIVKDMARGFIDYEKYGYAFQDSKFLENLFIGVSNELEINTLNYRSCQFYYQYYPQTPNMGPHIYHLERVIYAYTIVRERLNMVRQTGNIGYLTDISGMLFNDRNHLN